MAGLGALLGPLLGARMPAAPGATSVRCSGSSSRPGPSRLFEPREHSGFSTAAGALSDVGHAAVGSPGAMGANDAPDCSGAAGALEELGAALWVVVVVVLDDDGDEDSGALSESLEQPAMASTAALRHATGHMILVCIDITDSPPGGAATVPAALRSISAKVGGVSATVNNVSPDAGGACPPGRVRHHDMSTRTTRAIET